MTKPYTLYAAPSSLYSGRVRSWFRKREIPMIEVLPSIPRYRAVVRPAIGNHRIPAVETPDGAFIQDSTVILDTLEVRHPERPATPPGPARRIAMRLLEVLLLDGLIRPAMHYRWNFLHEQGHFIVSEFGRSLKPRGTPEEIETAGRRVAEKMAGKLAPLGVIPDTIPEIEASFHDLLRHLEACAFATPYLLGELPSLADYALMGPLYAHLGRDPVPHKIMRTTAPSVARWVEQMNEPGVASPEFPEGATAWSDSDIVPEPTRKLLAMTARDLGPELVANVEAWNSHCNDHEDAPAGSPITGDGMDQPSLPEVRFRFRGATLLAGVRVQTLWMLQRALDEWTCMGAQDRSACTGLLEQTGADTLLGLKMLRRVDRKNNRLVFGQTA
ncbi:MAG: glutathione S-transferase family protein [Hyphomonadaceae bacterium]